MIKIQNIYTVTQVNAYIKNMFTQDFMLQALSVRGEVSNCKYHSSGHIYFTLKDPKGTMACVMFAGNRNGLTFTLKEGMQVVVSGTVDVYERDGKYQMYARKIVQDGIGGLYEKFEELKRELEERGMFAAEYKRPVPKYIKTLGVVTAPTGAAVRDIINVATRRNPFIRIILYPAIVQGEAAPASIVNGIRAMERQDVDVIIVGRGGGSLEDLWAFNEEVVAQAIFDCEIPVISAVGHETDTTIADFVSDLRAPTPSAAAELAVYDYFQVEEKLRKYEELLSRQMRNQIRIKREYAERLRLNLENKNPLHILRERKTTLLRQEERMEHRIREILTMRKTRLQVLLEQFKGISPLNKLSQGYSYVEMDGKAVKSTGQVKPGNALTIHVTDGTIEAVVSKKTPLPERRGGKAGERDIRREIC